MSSVVANADVTLTFDNDTQTFVAAGNADSLVWDSVGKRLEINTTEGWKGSCAYLDLNSADPAIVPLKAELSQALINGGTLSYDIIVETTSIVGTQPGWFQTVYAGNSNAGWDQSLGGSGTAPELATYSFPLTAPIVHTSTYAIEVASARVENDARAQFGATSGYYQITLGVNTGTNPYAGPSTIKYYIDNFKIAANVVAAPVVIPKLTITPAIPGLNMVASSSGAYDRQTVRTYDGTDVTWVGVATPANPVSYEITVADCPKTGYETFINFVPGNATPSSAAHYIEPVAAGMWIYSTPNGGGGAYFRYKNGYANSNGPQTPAYPVDRMFWVQETTVPSDGLGGQIASVNSTKMLGTWKITFTSDIDFTMTAPDGASVSGVLNAAFAAKFANPDPVNTPTPIVVYFGNTPTPGNVGLTAVHSRIKISGTTYGPIDEDLVANPMSADLVVTAQVPASVIQVDPLVAKYWINWSLPATDFSLEQSTDLGAGGPWTALPSPTTLASQIGRSRLLLESEVLSTSTNFFRLVKPGTVEVAP